MLLVDHVVLSNMSFSGWGQMLAAR
jgi:hypothetical protein